MSHHVVDTLETEDAEDAAAGVGGGEHVEEGERLRDEREHGVGQHAQHLAQERVRELVPQHGRPARAVELGDVAPAPCRPCRAPQGRAGLGLGRQRREREQRQRPREPACRPDAPQQRLQPRPVQVRVPRQVRRRKPLHHTPRRNLLPLVLLLLLLLLLFLLLCCCISICIFTLGACNCSCKGVHSTSDVGCGLCGRGPGDECDPAVDGRVAQSRGEGRVRRCAQHCRECVVPARQHPRAHLRCRSTRAFCSAARPLCCRGGGCRLALRKNALRVKVRKHRAQRTHHAR